MLETYAAKYTDKFGEVETTIQNDGKELRMVVRGAEFICNMLDDWEPANTSNSELLDSFLIHPIFKTLYKYVLDFEIPVLVIRDTQILHASLSVHLEMDGVETNKAGGREELTIGLGVDGKHFRSCGRHGWFDDELQEIGNVLPEGMYIKSCFNCAFSDYSPAGFGLFGQLACFRNTKQEYLSLKGKAAYFKLQDKMAGLVQEIYLCPEFEKRTPGAGYRG
jgi:hypothetical protein